MATAKQIAAHKLFAERARSGAFKKRAPKKRKANPAKRQNHRYPTTRAVFDAASSNMNRAYRGFNVVFNALHDLYFVSKDGHHITSGNTRADVERQIDNLLDGEPLKRNPATAKRAAPRRKNPLLPGMASMSPRKKSEVFGYLVQTVYETGNNAWSTIAGFHSETDAKQYAHAYARMWKKRAVRVVDNYAD